MNAHQALKTGIASSEMISDSYLKDLTDSELMVRVVPGINHIAWQLGHLIVGEHDMINMVRPNSMPELPPGFREKHDRETHSSDDPKAFCTKAEYAAEMKKQRAGTLAVLDKLSDADLDQPAPEPLRNFLKTVGEVFSMQGSHWMMHAGQWAVLRRKLGRAPLF
jgi:hypothetical protein